MRIIDTHIHLGSSRLTHGPYTEQDLIGAWEENELFGMVVLPVSDPAPNARAAHDQIAAFAKSRPHVWGIVDANPKDEDYEEEFARCIEQLGFVGVKMMNIMNGYEPLGPISDKVFNMARKYDVPVIFHTGEGVPWSLPSMMIPRARQYPDVKIILAHSGAKIYHREAIIAAQECKNIYLETSWSFLAHLRSFINEIGMDRLMFGSDGFLNIHTSIVIAQDTAKHMKLSDEQLGMLLGENATRLFNLTV